MIGNSHVAQQSIVCEHTSTEFNDLGLVLVTEITLHEALVELDDLTEGEMLTGDSVETPRCLDDLRRQSSTMKARVMFHLHRLPVRTSQRNSSEPVMYLLQ